MVATVTGGTGYLGKRLVQELIKKQVVRVFSNESWTGSELPNLRCILGDVRDYERVLEACANADCVFHLAAQLPTSKLSNTTVWSINVDGTRNVLEASMKNNVRRVVYISSSSIYGIPSEVPCSEHSPKNPIGTYGRSKLMAERVCMEYVDKGLDVVVLRPMTIVGPGMKGVFRILFDWVKDDKTVYLIGNGSNRVQMVSVFDLVKACCLAAEEPAVAGQAMNIGSDNVPTVRELIQSLVKHAGSRSRIMSINPWFATIALRFFHLAGLSPLVAEHYYLANKDFILDTTRIKSLLNWKPLFSNVDMLNQAYDWFAQNTGAAYQYQGILSLVKLLS